MTKEMRPSHRVDVLSDAITYYRQKAVDNIGMQGMYIIIITIYFKAESSGRYMDYNLEVFVRCKM